MKLPMIAIISAVVGSASAIASHTVNERIAHHQREQEHIQSLMQHQPIEQGPGDMATVLPDGVLPIDASPTPGVPLEPGSARPQIQLKPGFAIPALPPLPVFGAKKPSKLVLVRTNQLVKETKDPIWTLQLVANGQVVDTLPALTGRFNRQTANRHVAGNKSPLPKGAYSIDRIGIDRGPFYDPELGKGYWVPITPLFNTGRSALGFHQDPSWGKGNGESGTSGCVGLESPEATAKLVDWIKHYNVQTLVVES